MSAIEPSPAAPGAGATDVARVVDHLFRREAGRLVAILVGRLGTAHLHLAEDVVQDALVRAMQVWPYTGVPENPSAWLLQTARNRAFDTLRRGRVLVRKSPALAPLLEDCAHEALAASPPQFEDEIADSQLRMIFVCCHPGLPADAQVALILKTLCGFGEREIASAFLAAEDAIVKKLVRARKFLRDSRVPTDLPPAEKLAPRVETVLHALYLLFNEGYKASHGDSLLRADLCAEAIRLGELLAAHPLGDRPATHALLALLHLHAARLAARVADDGALLVLAEQNRALWDRAQIRRGLLHLKESAAGPTVTRYHLEAGIAAGHALAPSYAETDWPHILELYNALLALDPSPVVALNRAVALAQVRGADAGLAALEKIPRHRALENYHLLHAVRGQLLLDAGRQAESALAFRRALALARQPAERALLERRLSVL
ncbi:MAG: sigma factor, ECF subfamily protein [Verrucomicrobia bacterium]|nr:sigma factor, ECF subfamily protein [Verrucomicrobiota bacterium]